jgi:hypothetical protein
MRAAHDAPGIDLHSNNAVVAVIDDQDRVLYCKRLANAIPAVRAACARRMGCFFAGAVHCAFELSVSPPIVAQASSALRF